MSGSAGLFNTFFFFTSSGAQRWAEREMGNTKTIRPPLALIVPDTPYYATVQVCIGTNVMGLCHDHCKKDFGPQILQRVMMPTAWEVAYRSLSYSAAVSIKAPKLTKPIKIGPEQQVVIHGYCHVGSSARWNLLVDSSVDCTLPGGLMLQSSMLWNYMSSRVPLCISNIGSKPVTISGQTTVAELQSEHAASANMPDKCYAG